MYFSPISSRKSTPRLNSRSSLVQRFHLVLSFATSLFLSFLRLTFFESLFAICFAVTMFFYFRLSIFNLGCQCLHHVPRKFYKVARFCSNTEFVRFHLFSSFVRICSYFPIFLFSLFLPSFLLLPLSYPLIIFNTFLFSFLLFLCACLYSTFSFFTFLSLFLYFYYFFSLFFPFFFSIMQIDSFPFVFR